jgi:CRP-like cAMP-binding protein
MIDLLECTVPEGKKPRRSMIDIQQKSDSGWRDFSLSDILASDELGGEIERWSPPILVTEGQVLFRQGDAPGNAFLVKTGEIALTMHVSGDALWSVRATKGSLVGLPAIVGNEPYSMTAKAIRDCQICKISRDDFHRLTQQNPRLCCNVLQILAGEVHAARKALSRFLVGPPQHSQRRR